MNKKSIKRVTSTVTTKKIVIDKLKEIKEQTDSLKIVKEAQREMFTNNVESVTFTLGKNEYTFDNIFRVNDSLNDHVNEIIKLIQVEIEKDLKTLITEHGSEYTHSEVSSKIS